MDFNAEMEDYPGMYQFNEEQQLIRKTIQNLVSKKIEPGVNQRVNDRIYPRKIMEELGSLGYKGLMIPSEFGGSGLDAVSSIMIVYEIAKADASVAQLLACINFMFCYPVFHYATPAQRYAYLMPCINNEKIGIFAANEPDGFGIGQISTTAHKENDDYILNGTKTMITDAFYGDYALVFAKTSENPRGFEGYSMFIVDLKDNPGVTVGKEEETMGLQSLKIADLHFHNVKVPRSALLGTEGEGIHVMLKALEMMRISNASVALGIAERAYEEALQYSKIRQINSAPMTSLQSIQFILADMKTKLEWMRLGVFYAAELVDAQIPNVLQYASMCKLKTTEYAKEICDQALQLFGGYGYVRGYTVERLYRDVRIFSIIGGPSESLLWGISNGILKNV